MKIKTSGFKIAFTIASIHCIIGNILGINFVGSTILETIFLPYTFIAGLSEFAGCDVLSFIFEIFSFLIMLGIFYPIGMLLEKK